MPDDRRAILLVCDAWMQRRQSGEPDSEDKEDLDQAMPDKESALESVADEPQRVTLASLSGSSILSSS